MNTAPLGQLHRLSASSGTKSSRRASHALGALVGASHAFWVLLVVLFVDLMLSDGQLKITSDADAQFIGSLLGRDLQPGRSLVRNAGVLPFVAKTRGQWLEPYAVAVYRSMPWTHGDASYLLGLMTAALLLGGGRALLLYWHNVFCSRIAAESAADLRRRLFQQKISVGNAAIDPSFGVRFAETIQGGVDSVEAGARTWFEVVPRELARSLACIAAALVLNAWLGLTFTLLSLLAWTLGSAARKRIAEIESRLAKESKVGLDRLRSLAEKTRLVKAYAADRYVQSHFESSLQVHQSANVRRLEFQARLAPLWGFLGLVVLLTVVGVAAQNVLTDRFGLASAAGVVAAILGLGWSAVQILIARPTLLTGESAAARLVAFLRESAAEIQQDGGHFLPTLSKGVELVNAVYRDANGRVLLDGVSCHIPAGVRTALLSTDPAEARAVVDLLCRFIEPAAGSVRFDGVDVRAFTLESLRAQACTLLGDELLFPNTVANNIGCGDPSFSRERIAEAAKVAHAHGFIERLPGGYDCTIGEGGRALSIGEAYRVAMARLILRDPALVILEEPSRSLDPESDDMLEDTLRRVLKRRTALLVPHRWGTLVLAERIVVLDRGKVVAAGTHGELFAEDPVYRFLLLARFADRMDRTALEAARQEAG